MNPRRLTRAAAVVAAVLTIATVVDIAAALSTAFTYQGEVEQNDTPVNGTCDFRFKLFDAQSGGTQIQASHYATGVAVSNGSFTTSVDFGSTEVAFPGADRWMEIAIKCPTGVGTYSTLSPREQLTATPYALHADRAGMATDLACSGCVAEGDLAANALSSLNGSSLKPLISVDNDGTGAAIAGVGGVGVIGTSQQSDSFGVVGNASNGASSAGVKGINTGPGYGGSFYSVLGTGLYARGGSNEPDVVLGGTSADDDGVISSDPAHAGSDIFVTSNDAVVVDLDQDGNEQGQFEIRDSAKNVLLRVTETTGLEAVTGDDNAIYATNLSGGHATIVAKNLGTFDYYRAVNEHGDTVFNVTHTGRVVTSAVQIKGGGDLGEKFHVPDGTTVDPGSLMIIDDEHAGALKLSERAYDIRVAGIASGAGGVNPGMTLEQEGVLDGDVTVAIAGRVYVKADARSAPIRPGDLLTSSEHPGTAMKATDQARSQGAVIGKAMSGLDKGTGMVLVLVNLQ